MMNTRSRRVTGWLVAASLAGITALAQGRSDADKKLPNPYRTIDNDFKMPPGRTLGSSSSIDLDPDGTSIWIADRCAAGSCLGSNLAAVFKFDAAGNMVKNFGKGFVYPRGIHVGSARTGVVTAFIPDPMGNQDEGAFVITSAAEGVVTDKDGVIYGIQVRPYGLFKYVKK